MLLFVILQDDDSDKEGRIGAPTACVGARETTLRNGMMSENTAHLCANCAAMNTDFSNTRPVCQNFTNAVCAH